MKPISNNPNKLAIISWCLFDWAYSPFSVLITTFIFATYFTQKIAVNPIIGTAQWANANALAGLMAALISPILGAIADREGRRKPWLLGFMIMIMIASVSLWWVKPDPNYVHFALFWIVIGTFALETGTVFYNAMLEELTSRKFLGRLSGWGWGCGYLGGLCALIIALQSVDSVEEIRRCGPLVAIWLLIFGWPLFVFVRDRPSTSLGIFKASRQGLRSLWQLLHLLRHPYKNILIFLIARMIYIDGLITVFAFGGIYAAGVFGMTMTEVMKFGIAMNIAAGIGAAVFGWLDDKRGSKFTILLSLLLMVICGINIVIVHHKLWFWIWGMGLSLGVGPVQAASRSLFIRISPPELITELFGLFTLSGRATAFIGPWILGMVTTYFSSQRAGILTPFLFMIIGGLLLTLVTTTGGRYGRPDTPPCSHNN